MRNRLSNLLLMTCLVGASSLALSAPVVLEAVGNLGDPQRLVFEENAAFPNPLLCGALRSSLDYVLLAQPNSPLPDLLEALPKLLVAGYRNAGFGEAQVAARHDTNRQRLVITIHEGPRYRCGALKVTGAKDLPVKLLVDRLRQELSPTNMPSTQPGSDLLAEAARLDKDTPSPLEQLGLVPAGGITMITNSSQVAVPAGTWHPNGFAAFDPGAQLRYAEAVTNAFRALGWYGARFATALAPDRATYAADLVVTIEDEGRPVTLREIEVAGLKRNSRKEVLNYVGLEPGMRLTEDLEVLDQADVDALAAVLPEADATLLRQARTAMKQGRGKPLDEVLGPALDQWWKAALKDRMGALLRRLLAPTASRAAESQAPTN
jgi:hypothetical protein